MDRALKYGSLQGFGMALLLMILFFPCLVIPRKENDNFFTIYIDGEPVAHTMSADYSDYLREARLRVSEETGQMVVANPDIFTEGTGSWFGLIDSKDDIIDVLAEALRDSLKRTLHPSYTVKVGKTVVALGSKEETMELLNRIIEPYDDDSLYKTQIISDPNRELSVLVSQIIRRSEEELLRQNASDYHKNAGMSAMMEGFYGVAQNPEKGYANIDDYELGLISIDYGKPVEMVETFLPESELSNVNEALDLLTKEQDQQVIYKVVSGDSLSEIAQNFGIPMDRLVEINPTIETVNDTIKIGDEIIITQPKPELSVVYSELAYHEEDYDAPIEYVDNNDWYTNQTKTLQQPSAGHRNVLAMVTYVNNQKTGEAIEFEEVVMNAVPKIVERGTKAPPTFIKPISGGRVSSPFGRRSAPTKGASTNHKGIDWAIPVGTAVMASSGGTITRAGWGSGYGYVVYIDHGDGRETRYGHLSKVLVKVGQKVRQGEKIALSGNTGRSTGPHIHFEILVNGVAVNPTKYMT